MPNSDQDRILLELHIDPQHPALEPNLIRLFMVNLVGLIRAKAEIAKNYHTSPSEIDHMFYWEYEYYVDSINKSVKEENERNEEAQEQMGDMNPKSMMGNMSKMMPKAPDMSKMRFNMPGIK